MKITKRNLIKLIREQAEITEETFNVGDKVKMNPIIAKKILAMFGKGPETAYVNFDGIVKKVFKFGIMVSWANGTGNVNPRESLIKI